MAGRWRRLAVVAALAMLGGGVAPAGADDAVEWRAIDASALLDRDGVLHVSERITVAAQGPVVAERWFREWRRSRVTLASVGRLDPRTGALSPLTAGSPDAAGVYSFQDGVLKWSVGQPAGDAGEAGNVEVYQIEYTVPAIVPIWGVRRFSPRTVLAPFAMDPRRRAEELWQGWRMAPGGLLRRYLLDFGFSPFPVNAGGPVGRFSLELRVDPTWRLLAVPIPRSGPIAADDDLRDFLPLDFVGPGAPSAGLRAYHALWVAPLVVMPILSLVLVGSLLLRVHSLKRRFGRDEVRMEWFRSQVLTRSPEEVRALADVTGTGTVHPGRAATIRKTASVVPISLGIVLSIVTLEGGGFFALVAGLVLGSFVYNLTRMATIRFDSAPTLPTSRLIALVVPAILFPAAFVVFFLGVMAYPLALHGLACFWLGLTNMLVNGARPRWSEDEMEFRFKLARARDVIAKELDGPRPALEDGWLPWLEAMGLGGEVESWRKGRGMFVTGVPGAGASPDVHWTGRPAGGARRHS